MDKETFNYYYHYAESAFYRYIEVEGGVSRYFHEVFEKDEHVLEIGFGSGRDLVRLLNQGIDAVGVDPCPQFINLARERFSELKKRVFAGHLPDGLHRFADGSFDGVLCSAVLMHIDDDELSASLTAIANLLKPAGKLLISIPESRPDMKDEKRDAQGRLMVLRMRQTYIDQLTQKGFIVSQLWENADAMSRQGIQWVTIYLTKTAA
ncbi:MAG TPA: class I SAM-dependent methyltransferase [Desulfobacteraceae bacterium]|nr:class I SAM-dependent methyltransferase [Desulfobacteraceae bacterium]